MNVGLRCAQQAPAQCQPMWPMQSSPTSHGGVFFHLVSASSLTAAALTLAFIYFVLLHMFYR